MSTPPAPWPYHAVTTPLLTAMLVALVGRIAEVASWPTVYVAMGAVMLVMVSSGVAVVMEWGPVGVLYATLTATVAGAWTVWAAHTSAYSMVSLGYLVLATTSVGAFYGPVRYQVHKRKAEDAARAEAAKAAEEKLRRPRHLWERILDAAGYPGLTHISTVDTPAGYSVQMKLPAETGKRATARSLFAGLDSITIAADVALGGNPPIRSGAIKIEQGVAASDVILHITVRDILAEKIDLPTHTAPATIRAPIDLGLFEDGTPIEVPFLYVQATVVGMTDAGKSNLLNLLIYGLTRCTDTLVWVAAPDKGVPLVAPWLKPYIDGHTDTPLLDWVATDTTECARMLLGMYKTADIRSRTPRGGADKVTPSPQQPYIIGILEEASGILDSTQKWKTHKGEMRTASWIAKEITRLGRSEGLSLITVTQRGTVSMYGAHGGDMKANIGLRMGLRTAQSTDNRYVFPDDPELALHKLVHNGSVYLKRIGIDNRPIPGKLYYLDPQHRIPLEAQRHTSYVSSMEITTEQQLGSIYTERWSDERAGALCDLLRGITPPADHENSPTPPDTDTNDITTRAGSLATLAPPDLPRSYRDALAAKGADEQIHTDVAELIAGLEQLLAEAASPEPEPYQPLEAEDSDSTDPRRAIAIDLIRKAGAEGMTVKTLLLVLDKLNMAPARGTLHRWLAEAIQADVLCRQSHGRYVHADYYDPEVDYEE